MNSMQADPFATLNLSQREAVTAGSDAPLLIIAGAGTGKTTTLAHRIAKLVIDGADPRRILLLTFSRRAAQEMIRRAQRVARGVELPWAGHGFDAISWGIGGQVSLAAMLRFLGLVLQAR